MDSKNVNKTYTPFLRRHGNFLVGIFVLIPMVGIPFLLIYTLFSNCSQSWKTLYTVYKSSNGLKSGNTVTISGIDVGKVHTVKLEREGRVIVEMRIKRNYWPHVKKNMKATLRPKNLAVGDWTIELMAGIGNALPSNEYDTLVSEMPLAIDDMLASASLLVNDIDKLVREILMGRGSIGKLITEDSLLTSIQNIANGIEVLTKDSRFTIKQTDTLIMNFIAIEKQSLKIMDSLTTIVGSVNATLADVQKIAKNAEGASQEVSPMLERVYSELDEVDMLMQSLKKNWLLRSVIGKQVDTMIIDP